MKALICRYKVNKSYKKLLLVGNGSPSSVFAIQIQKTFDLKTANEIAQKINSGQF